MYHPPFSADEVLALRAKVDASPVRLRSGHCGTPLTAGVAFITGTAGCDVGWI